MIAREKKVQDQLYAMRHSLAHIMAAAIQTLWPQVKFGVGPVIENGFYYDIDLGDTTLSPEDLPKIEAQMRKIISSNVNFERKERSLKEAIDWAKQQQQPYKVELLADLRQHGTTSVKDIPIKELVDKSVDKISTVSFYQSGDFEDLCRGPHVSSTKEIGAFKLERLAGAYWRGSEKNPMLTRIYGVAFTSEAELKQYFKQQTQARLRDHKKLGRKLELFFFHPTSPGMAYWLPKGVILRQQLLDYWRQTNIAAGYQEISAPLLNKKELFETSGHWDHYLENMFTSDTEDATWALKAMNCPNAMIVYQFENRSYRDLPLRLADSDTLHRNEPSGTLNGLLRARSFQQDDAHIFVTEEQIKSEYQSIFEYTEKYYSLFGLEFSFRLGTRPENFMGDIKLWDKAEKDLKEILETSQRDYVIEEGDGAFYGPKIDILMKDAMGREWQMGTIQLDFQIPRRFGLTYTDERGQEKIPAVIHHVIYGSIDRFLGILIEHTEGRFPVWLAPEQVRITTVNDNPKLSEFAQKLQQQLMENSIRSNLDNSNETVSKKIRNAEVMKVPYTLVVGDKEIKSGMFTPRVRADIHQKHHDQPIKLEEFIQTVKNEAKSHIHTSSL